MPPSFPGHDPTMTGGVRFPPPQAPPKPALPAKEVNAASFCRIGQDTVQDVVNKTLDLFKFLSQLQLPTGVSSNVQNYQERKTKLDEMVKQLTLNFKKLRLLYDKVNDNTVDLPQGQPEELLPIENEAGDVSYTMPRSNDNLKYASEEHREVVEQIQSKNRQLKEIIDQLRTVTWEINTMLAMRP